MKSVQIIGTQRSGSNLLRLMLNQIEGVFAPHPPHIVSTFFSLLPGYGNLNVNEIFFNLIDDACTVVELNPVAWENLYTDRTKIFERCNNRSLSEVFKAIYEINAQVNKSHTWICKSMQNVKYLDHFESNGFKPKIIYLYRDGRDVALSFKKAIVGPKHMYSIAQKWKYEQELSLKVLKEKSESDAMYLSYESLIDDPEKQIQEVCDFLNIKYTNSVLNYFDSNESKKTAEAGEMWTNLKNPIIKNNTNKFLRELDSKEVRLFEHINYNVLQELGYNLSKDFMKDEYHFSEEDIKSIEKINLQMQIDIRRSAPMKDLRKRGAQDDFIKELKKKLEVKAA